MFILFRTVVWVVRNLIREMRYPLPDIRAIIRAHARVCEQEGLRRFNDLLIEYHASEGEGRRIANIALTAMARHVLWARSLPR